MALLASLTFSVSHLAFHASHLTGPDAGSAVGLLVALGLGVLLPAGLLLLNREEPAHR
ncbi:hypothetical protein ACWD6R_29705 [Streptomyces sp. NPDC005151]